MSYYDEQPQGGVQSGGGDDDDYNFRFEFDGKSMGSIISGSSEEELEEAAAQTVTGIGISDEEQASSEEAAERLRMLNEQNTELVRAEAERLAAEQEAREASVQAAKEAERAKRLSERAEAERLEREELRRKEEEEEARLAQEAEERRKASPLYKMKEGAAALAAKTAEAAKQRVEESKAAKVAEAEAKAQAAEAAKLAKEESLASSRNGEESSEVESTEGSSQKKQKSKPSKQSKQEKKQAPEKPDFEYLATHDKLTGLKNLTAYELDIEACDPARLAVLYFDINDLKLANDTHGHEVGNKLIMATAGALSELFPDRAYRLGGDEFVVIHVPAKKENTKEFIESKIARFKTLMAQARKGDEFGLTYAVSVGYAIGDGLKSAKDVQHEADQAMYEQKKAYKKAHPVQSPAKKEQPKVKADHDSLLSDEQRMLKEVIKDNHCIVSEASTEKIIREIQSKRNEVVAILVASPTFDSLVIIQDVDEFIEMTMEDEIAIDYSYIYVVFENGTQFFGVDEYYDEVTVLFTEIGKVLKNSPYLSDKDILKIKGVNIFKEIYID